MSNRNSIKSNTVKESKKTKGKLVEALKTIGLFLLLCLFIFALVHEATHRPLHVENKDGLAYVAYGEEHLGAVLLDENGKEIKYEDYINGKEHKLIKLSNGNAKKSADAVLIYDVTTNTIYVGSAIHKDYKIKELEPYYYEE